MPRRIPKHAAPLSPDAEKAAQYRHWAERMRRLAAFTRRRLPDAACYTPQPTEEEAQGYEAEGRRFDGLADELEGS